MQEISINPINNLGNLNLAISNTNEFELNYLITIYDPSSNQILEASQETIPGNSFLTLTYLQSYNSKIKYVISRKETFEDTACSAACKEGELTPQ